MSAVPITPPPRSLVTGATGLLGSNIVHALLAGGGEVTALVRDVERARRLLPNHPGLTIVGGDVTVVRSYRRHLSGIDAVFHTAAYFREYYQSGSNPALLYRTNVHALEKLLYASARAAVPVVVHTSSVGVLGLGTMAAPANEDTPPGATQRRNAYFASKIRGEEAVARCSVVTGQRVPMILPGMMWGPGDAGPTAAGRLFLSVASGTMKAAPNAGHHLVDARDVAAVCVRAATSGVSGRRYVVAGRWYHIPQVFAEIAAVTRVPAPWPVPARLILSLVSLAEAPAKLLRGAAGGFSAGLEFLVEGDHSRYTSARAERELGASFRPLADTIRDEADWYREHHMLAGAARQKAA